MNPAVTKSETPIREPATASPTRIEVGGVRKEDRAFAVLRIPPVTKTEFLQAVETIRDRAQRSYIAEVFFIRVNEQHFINFSAQLQFNHIDIFSSAFNVEELFSMFLDGNEIDAVVKSSIG